MGTAIVVSACLLGHNCRWDGTNNLVPHIRALAERIPCLAVCPEELGGLPTPRTPCEIVPEGENRRVLARDGQDRTGHFAKGAEKALAMARSHGCSIAILKSRSPSCGKGRVFDGTFSKTLVDGHGLFAGLLLDNGFHVLTDEEFVDNPDLILSLAPDLPAELTRHLARNPI